MGYIMYIIRLDIDRVPNMIDSLFARSRLIQCDTSNLGHYIYRL